MMVTVLPCDGIVPGTMKCLQVIAEIQETRSKRSVFGFRFSFRRLPAGSLRHVSPPLHRQRRRGRLRAGRLPRARSPRCGNRGQQQQRDQLVQTYPEDEARAGPGRSGRTRGDQRCRQRPDCQFGARRAGPCGFGSVQSPRVTPALPAPIRRGLWDWRGESPPCLRRSSRCGSRGTTASGCSCCSTSSRRTFICRHGQSQRAPCSPGAGA